MGVSLRSQWRALASFSAVSTSVNCTVFVLLNEHMPWTPRQGIVLKGTFTRGGQQFIFPVILSHRADDWRVLLGAYLLPPVAVWSARTLVYRPLVRRQRLAKVGSQLVPHSTH